MSFHELPLFTRLARVFVTTALGTSSLSLAVAQLAAEEQTLVYLTLNKKALPARLFVIGLCWGIGALVAALACWWSTRAHRPAARMKGVIHLFAPLVPAAFWPIIFVDQVWEGRELAYLAYLLVLGLCEERLLHPAISLIERRTRSWPVRQGITKLRGAPWLSWVTLGVAFCLGLYYLLHIGRLTNVSHFKFQTSSSDLAEYDNLFFNALSGHPFRAPAVATLMKDWSNLSNHCEPVLYLLLPFYAISPGAHALLWIQSGLIGFSAVPIYLLASARLGRAVGLAFAAAFLLMPVTQQPNFYDFHFTSAALFFISWLLYFVYRLKHAPEHRGLRVGVYVALLCSLLCREDIGIGTSVIGIFLLFRGVLIRDAINIATFSAFYFISVKFALMPQFGTWWFDDMYGELKSEGAKGFSSIILTLLSNQAFVLRAIMNEPKALYLLHMTAPVLALWLRRPLLVLAVAPAMISSLLVTSRPPLFQSSFQYTYLWLGYTLAASILAVARERKYATALVVLLLGLSLDVQKGLLLGGERIMGGFSMKDLVVRPVDEKRMEQFRSITADIPKDAVVASTEREGPHLSSRPVFFSLKFSLGHDPEYLVVAHPGIRGEKDHIRAALESGKYGVIKTVGPYTLVKRGASTKKNGRLLRRVGGQPQSSRPKQRPQRPQGKPQGKSKRKP